MEPVAVERPLLGELGSEASGRGSRWEKRGGEDSRVVSEVVGRDESEVSRGFEGTRGCGSVWVGCLSESSFMTGT